MFIGFSGIVFFGQSFSCSVINFRMLNYSRLAGNTFSDINNAVHIKDISTHINLNSWHLQLNTRKNSKITITTAIKQQLQSSSNSSSSNSSYSTGGQLCIKNKSTNNYHESIKDMQSSLLRQINSALSINSLISCNQHLQDYIALLYIYSGNIPAKYKFAFIQTSILTVQTCIFLRQLSLLENTGRVILELQIKFLHT